jgi:DNA-binding transcriptional ArsR family regulator
MAAPRRTRSRGRSIAGGVVYRAVSDPTRRAILDGLADGPLTVNEIAGRFTVSRPAISKHLRLLRRARLVRQQRQGRRRVYHLDPTPLRAIDRWLARYRLFWSARLLDLKDFVESEGESR